MPRTARQPAPAAYHHLIGRIVNQELRITGDAERTEYLRRLGLAIERCDWTLLGYAVMSNHVHLVCRSGRDPAERLIRPVHSGFGRWLNRTQGRYGPVFAERFRCVLVGDDTVGRVLAYVHNNPVRAGVVADPVRSTWTSHRAYLGFDEAPAWLDVRAGLHAAGHDATRAGRMSFHAYALAQAGCARETVFDGEADALRESRRQAGSPVELVDATLVVPPGGGLASPHHAVVGPPAMPLRPRWAGEPMTVVENAAGMLRLPVEVVRSRRRSRRVVAARRLAMLVWTGGLHREQTEMARALGVSGAAASHLLHRNDDAVADLATHVEWLTAKCWSLSKPHASAGV
jgi:hypothetical protein